MLKVKSTDNNHANNRNNKKNNANKYINNTSIINKLKMNKHLIIPTMVT